MADVDAERLLARLDDLRLDPGREPERNHGLLLYSFKALPIRFAGAGTTDRSAGR